MSKRLDAKDEKSIQNSNNPFLRLILKFKNHPLTLFNPASSRLLFLPERGHITPSLKLIL